MRERLTIFVIVGMRTDGHSLRSQVGIGSESDCLLGQLERILEISDSMVGRICGTGAEKDGEDVKKQLRAATSKYCTAAKTARSGS